MTIKTHVFFHKNCFDGTMAAAVMVLKVCQSDLWKREETKFIPCSYTDDIGDLDQYVNTRVLILDMTFDSERLEQLCRVASDVLVIDHHPKARAQVIEYFDLRTRPVPPNLHFCTDTESNPRSGAQLTWDYFFDPAAQPDCVRWIGKGDRWIFDEPEIRAFRMAMGTLGFDPDIWKSLLLEAGNAVQELVQKGYVIEEVTDSQLDYLEANATSRMTIAGYNVVVVDAPKFLASEIAQRLYSKLSVEESPFIAVHYEEGGMLTYSLRLDKEKNPTLDLGEVARKFGGGGHASAAGFEVRIAKAPLDPPTPKPVRDEPIFISRFFDPFFRAILPKRG